MTGFKKVLFVDLVYPGSFYHKGRNIAPSMGIGYLSQILENSGIKCKVFDLSLGYTKNDLENLIYDFKPELAAFSLMTFKYKHHYKFIKEIKEILPSGAKIIVGGAHITSWEKKIFKECDFIDFAAVKEGEETILELCMGNDYASIKGLIYRQNNEIISNPQRLLISNLDKIPFPRYKAFEINKYEDIIHICSTRGCPFQCTFCQFRDPAISKWRARSAENVIEEISFWYEKGYRKFSFIDDNFTLDKNRAAKICEYIEQKGFSNLWLSAVGIRADRIDFNLLKKMKEVGFKSLSIGVESASPPILKLFKKSESIEEIEKAVGEAISLDFSVKLYFVVGYPGETLTDVKKSIDFALKYPVAAANFSNLVPFPDTELFTLIKKTGRFLREPEDYLDELGEFDGVPLFEAPGMTLEERKYALKITAETSDYIKKKNLSLVK
ncbi:MAG: radical SAM protein [Armatimonadetes bacterium]|nr:radical SAM protein [Armatimonadota bacterium]